MENQSGKLMDPISIFIDLQRKRLECEKVEISNPNPKRTWTIRKCSSFQIILFRMTKIHYESMFCP